MKQNNPINRILIFRIGQLGDTLVALPTIRFFRTRFPKAHFTLLSDAIAGKEFVHARDVFENSGLINDFILYKKPLKENAWRTALAMLALLPRLRLKNIDAVVYLAPSMRDEKKVARDRFFFRLTGARHLWGFQRTADGQPVHEADRLLHYFKLDGFDVPELAAKSRILALSADEKEFARLWLEEKRQGRNGSLLIGFGPGSKMQAKRWRVDNFWQVGHDLIRKYDAWPIVFGGAADRKIGDSLIRSWKRGYNAAGELSIRQSGALLQACDFFIGNDTGTMHLAAAVDTPCVALFSARDEPGKWDPMGDNHIVLRRQVKCSGCMAHACDDKICLMLIRPEDVIQAAEKIIERLVKRKNEYAS